MQIDLNTEVFSREIKLLNRIDSEINDLYFAMSKISLDEVELESAAAFKLAIKVVNSVINGGDGGISLSELKKE